MEQNNRLQDLINACENAGVKYNLEYEGQIGIKTGRFVWHWFETSFLLFQHSYSQNTGSTKKGTRHGWKIKDAITKKTGFDFYPFINKQ